MSDTELRELDAWIAEHVMGWTVKSRTSPHSGSSREHFWFEPGNDIEPKYRGLTYTMSPSGNVGGERCAPEIAHYTTDPAAAMWVLEKCCDDAPNAVEIIHEFNPWEVRTRKSNKPGDFLEVHAETLPLAICLFARKLFSK